MGNCKCVPFVAVRQQAREVHLRTDIRFVPHGKLYVFRMWHRLLKKLSKRIRRTIELPLLVPWKRWFLVLNTSTVLSRHAFYFVKLRLRILDDLNTACTDLLRFCSLLPDIKNKHGYLPIEMPCSPPYSAQGPALVWTLRWGWLQHMHKCESTTARIRLEHINVCDRRLVYQ